MPNYQADTRRIPITELMAKPALTMREAGLVLNISADQLTRIIAAGEGPDTFKIGRVTYVRTETLAAWLRMLESDARILASQEEPSAH
jgi:hypothetical protein